MRIVRQGKRFCEVELDALSVTMLLDGETTMPLDCLRAADGTTLATADLIGADLKDGALRLPVRAFLVRGAMGNLLIDTGAGQAWHKGLGQLGAALDEAGIGALEVTAVALTHTHIDHVSGLVDDDGGLAFPNATRVFVATEEIMALRSNRRMMPVALRLVALEQGDGPMRGVTAINAPGHSPGHMCFLVEGRLLISGDLIHSAGVQCIRPEVCWKYDEDPGKAYVSRVALLEQAVEQGWILAGAHLPEPGFGLIERAGDAFSFRPAKRGF